MSGCRIRGKVVSAANIKVFHERPEHMRHEFEDEFAHLAWGADLGLGITSTVAVSLYTLTDRKAVGDPGGARDWYYKGRYQRGAESECLEEEVRDSFTPLQLDVFHALWETYKDPGCRPRPKPAPLKGKRDTESRARALQDFPVGTQVGRPFEGTNGVSRVAVGEVYDCPGTIMAGMAPRRGLGGA